MREPQFLPPWYPQLMRRRRVMVMQAWSTIIVAAALAIWAALDQRKETQTQARLQQVQAQLAATGVDLQRLNDIETVKRQLEQQDRVVRKLGLHVPASRLIAALDEMMPPEMALCSLDIETLESTDALSASAANAQIHRKLQVHLIGLSPTEEQLAMFMTRLVAVPFFSEVELVRSEDHPGEGRLMRQFELNFALDLDDDTGPLAEGE